VLSVIVWGGVFGYRSRLSDLRGSGGTVSIRLIARVVSVASLGLGTVVGSGLMALPASAAGTTTLHFYSVQQAFTATNAAGQPITASTTIPVGAHYDTTDLYFVGNHQHHASSFSASDHIACTVTSASTQTCNGQIAIGGSLLLGNDVTVPFGQNGAGTLPINAGTGKYKNAQGTVSETFIANSNNVDITIALTST
jgi:hypothetical protein